MQKYTYNANVDAGYQKDTGCTALWGGGCGCPRTLAVRENIGKTYQKPMPPAKDIGKKEGLAKIIATNA